MSVAAGRCWNDLLRHGALSRGGLRLVATSCDVVRRGPDQQSMGLRGGGSPVRDASEEHDRFNAEGFGYIEELHRIEPPFSGFDLGDVVGCTTELRREFTLREPPFDPGCPDHACKGSV